MADKQIRTGLLIEDCLTLEQVLSIHPDLNRAQIFTWLHRNRVPTAIKHKRKWYFDAMALKVIDILAVRSAKRTDWAKGQFSKHVRAYQKKTGCKRESAIRYIRRLIKRINDNSADSDEAIEALKELEHIARYGE